MENSRLWQVLISLNAAERKHLKPMVTVALLLPAYSQPFALYSHICEAVWNLAASRPRSAQSGRYFGRKSADVQALRAVMTELMGHIEHFLVYSEKFDRKGDYHIRLAEAYRKRGLEKHFRQSLHAARSDWARQPYRHAEYFDAQMAIEYELYQYQTAGRRTEALNWQELSNQTDTAFIARKLRQACFALSHQMVYSTGYNFGLLDMVVAHMRGSEALQAIPSVGLYYFCYLFLTEAGRGVVFSGVQAAAAWPILGNCP